jgi:hypothetical protein
MKKRLLFSAILAIHAFCFSSIFFLFTSCENTDEEAKLFSKIKKLSSYRMNVEDKLGTVNSMKSINDYIVITGKNIDTQAQAQLINKKTKESYFFGETGQGPGRLLQSSSDVSLFIIH